MTTIEFQIVLDGVLYTKLVDWGSVPRVGDSLSLTPEGWEEDADLISWTLSGGQREDEGSVLVSIRDVQDIHGEGLAGDLLECGWRVYGADDVEALAQYFCVEVFGGEGDQVDSLDYKYARGAIAALNTEPPSGFTYEYRAVAAAGGFRTGWSATELAAEKRMLDYGIGPRRYWLERRLVGPAERVEDET